MAASRSERRANSSRLRPSSNGSVESSQRGRECARTSRRRKPATGPVDAGAPPANPNSFHTARAQWRPPLASDSSRRPLRLAAARGSDATARPRLGPSQLGPREHERPLEWPRMGAASMPRNRAAQMSGGPSAGRAHKGGAGPLAWQLSCESAA